MDIWSIYSIPILKFVLFLISFNNKIENDIIVYNSCLKNIATLVLSNLFRAVSTFNYTNLYPILLAFIWSYYNYPARIYFYC